MKKKIKLQLLETKIKKKEENRIKIFKKCLKELEIKRINKTKELEKVGIELGRLEIKIKRIKGGLEEFEIKILEMETEVQTEILKKI